MSSGSMPAVRIARIAATAAIDAVVSCAAATRRSRMPGAGDDPLVGRVDHPLEVGVRQHLRRGVAAPAGDMGVARDVAHSGSTSISGCLALTSVPLSGMTWTTRPARSDLISLNSFIASMRPMTWPTATSPPTVTYGAEPGAGERVEDAGQRRLDRRAWPGRPGRDRPRPARRGPPPSAGAARPAPPASATGRRDRGRLAQDEPGPAGLDLELGQVRAVEQGRQPVDEREQRGVAVVVDRRLGRAPAVGRRPPSGVCPVVGHPSHRVKTRAVFWPPKPNELLSATRISRGARDVRRQVEALGAPGRGRRG